MTRIRFVFPLTGGLLLVACSAATRGPGVARCVPEALDSAWVVAGPVYRNCEVDRVVRLENSNPPYDYQPTQACETVLLEYVVDTTGLVESGTERYVRGNSPALARVVVASLPRYRYRPAMKAGVKVRQVVQNGSALVSRREQFGQPRQPTVSSQVSCIP